MACNYSNISIKHHFYSSYTEPYSLSMKYTESNHQLSDRVSQTGHLMDFEMLLGFNDLESMSSFESVR